MLIGILRCIVFLAMLLSRLAGNYMGDEGAGMLAEPLGKLTALQQLYLQSTVSGLIFLERIQGHC